MFLVVFGDFILLFWVTTLTRVSELLSDSESLVSW